MEMLQKLQEFDWGVLDPLIKAIKWFLLIEVLFYFILWIPTSKRIKGKLIWLFQRRWILKLLKYLQIILIIAVFILFISGIVNLITAKIRKTQIQVEESTLTKNVLQPDSKLYEKLSQNLFEKCRIKKKQCCGEKEIWISAFTLFVCIAVYKHIWMIIEGFLENEKKDIAKSELEKKEKEKEEASAVKEKKEKID